MNAGVPLWLAILVAVLTGTFAVVAQWVSGITTRNSQKLLFAQQKDAEARNRVRMHAEELFSLVFSLFDQVHECVVRHRFYRAGKNSRENVIEAIEANTEPDRHQRTMLLINLYFPGLRPSFLSLNGHLNKITDALDAWRRDKTVDKGAELEREFDGARRALAKLTDEIRDLVK